MNETHLKPKILFNIPNVFTYKNDWPSTGNSNFEGTAILIKRNISHLSIQIQTSNIKNTIIHLVFNNQILRLGDLYKNPEKIMCSSDFNLLLGTQNNMILAGDLNGKNPIWRSFISNIAEKTPSIHGK